MQKEVSFDDIIKRLNKKTAESILEDDVTDVQSWNNFADKIFTKVVEKTPKPNNKKEIEEEVELPKESPVELMDAVDSPVDVILPKENPPVMERKVVEKAAPERPAVNSKQKWFAFSSKPKTKEHPVESTQMKSKMEIRSSADDFREESYPTMTNKSATVGRNDAKTPLYNLNISQSSATLHNLNLADNGDLSNRNIGQELLFNQYANIESVQPTNIAETQAVPMVMPPTVHSVAPLADTGSQFSNRESTAKETNQFEPRGKESQLENSNNQFARMKFNARLSNSYLEQPKSSSNSQQRTSRLDPKSTNLSLPALKKTDSLLGENLPSFNTEFLSLEDSIFSSLNLFDSITAEKEKNEKALQSQQSFSSLNSDIKDANNTSTPNLLQNQRRKVVSIESLRGTSLENMKELYIAEQNPNLKNADYYGCLHAYVNQSELNAVAAKEKERVKKWEKMKLNNAATIRENGKFCSRLEKGIPQSLRGKIWCKLLAPGENVYLPKIYLTLSSQASPHEENIRAGASRALRFHIKFAENNSLGYQELVRLMRAVSLQFPTLGYNSNICKWAAMLLTVTSEQNAFLIMDRILAPAGRNTIFSMYNIYLSTTFINECLYIHTKLLETFLPRLARHLSQNNLKIQKYLMPWISSLFVSCTSKEESGWAGLLQYQSVLQVFDLYALHGLDVLHMAPIVILFCYQSQIVQMEGDDLSKFVFQGEKVAYYTSITTTSTEMFVKSFLKFWNDPIKLAQPITYGLQRSHSSIDEPRGAIMKHLNKSTPVLAQDKIAKPISNKPKYTGQNLIKALREQFESDIPPMTNAKASNSPDKKKQVAKLSSTEKTQNNEKNTVKHITTVSNKGTSKDFSKIKLQKPSKTKVLGKNSTDNDLVIKKHTRNNTDTGLYQLRKEPTGKRAIVQQDNVNSKISRPRSKTDTSKSNNNAIPDSRKSVGKQSLDQKINLQSVKTNKLQNQVTGTKENTVKLIAKPVEPPTKHKDDLKPVPQGKPAVAEKSVKVDKYMKEVETKSANPNLSPPNSLPPKIEEKRMKASSTLPERQRTKSQNANSPLKSQIVKGSKIPVRNSKTSLRGTLRKLQKHSLQMVELHKHTKNIDVREKTMSEVASSSLSENMDKLGKLKTQNHELHERIAFLEGRLLKEEEKNKGIPKVTSIVPTSLEANIHLRYQYHKNLENERKKYAALELENERLLLAMKELSLTQLKKKKAKDVEIAAQHLNDIAFWKTKLKELELDNHQLIELITKREITIEKLAKEKEYLHEEMMTMRRLQMHLSNKLDQDFYKESEIPVDSTQQPSEAPIRKTGTKFTPHYAGKLIRENEFSLREGNAEKLSQQFDIIEKDNGLKLMGKLKEHPVSSHHQKLERKHAISNKTKVPKEEISPIESALQTTNKVENVTLPKTGKISSIENGKLDNVNTVQVVVDAKSETLTEKLKLSDEKGEHSRSKSSPQGTRSFGFTSKTGKSHERSKSEVLKDENATFDISKKNLVTPQNATIKEENLKDKNRESKIEKGKEKLVNENKEIVNESKTAKLATASSKDGNSVTIIDSKNIQSISKKSILVKEMNAPATKSELNPNTLDKKLLSSNNQKSVVVKEDNTPHIKPDVKSHTNDKKPLLSNTLQQSTIAEAEKKGKIKSVDTKYELITHNAAKDAISSKKVNSDIPSHSGASNNREDHTKQKNSSILPALPKVRSKSTNAAMENNTDAIRSAKIQLEYNAYVEKGKKK
ncbi:Rab GTPase-activating protein 1 [Boothiomyces sp. JEL0866]|nr:Rab GTPase-activating protein 1 [Boothiomyces sp. JEL0866]KAJ3321984.1 Rab GTPase-activating protein 1 [Boothiomyces sp. JEL0866]